MPFYKVAKNKSYFSRYQVKFRRRREGKTDYYQRKRLVFQYKDKYNTKKYRLVVRMTNQYITCQIVYAAIVGDVVVCQANSKELLRYGIKVGFCNYSAAYATGLLVARRMLHKLGIDSKHKGCVDPKSVGADFNNDKEVDGARAFKAVLDIGLARSTTGSKVFGAMKGALDGGINVPHDPKRFVGNKKGGEYNPEVHREHIYGVHVSKYMKLLENTQPQRFQKQFSAYLKAGVTSDKVESMYAKAFELIRADPSPAPKKPFKKVEKKKLTKREVKRKARAAIAKRQNRVEKKKERILAKLKATA